MNHVHEAVRYNTATSKEGIRAGKLPAGRELTCGTEEKDVGVSEELIQFVRHMRLSVRDRAEAVLVLLAQVRINVVKQQGKRRAPESLDLRHENGISCCRSNVTRSANLWPICAFLNI